MDWYCLSYALKLTSPVFFGYIAIGIPFGLMTVSGGYPIWLAVLMSVGIYAGAGQYMVMMLFVTGADIATVAISTLLVNIRHIVYGLSLIDTLKPVRLVKPYIIFSLTDETYALMTVIKKPPKIQSSTFYGLIAALDHFYWILGSTLGAVAGTLIPFDFEGIDFALTALFAVLLVEQVKSSHEYVSPIVGSICTIGAAIACYRGLLDSRNILLVAIICTVLFLVIFHREKKQNAT